MDSIVDVEKLPVISPSLLNIEVAETVSSKFCIGLKDFYLCELRF